MFSEVAGAGTASVGASDVSCGETVTRRFRPPQHDLTATTRIAHSGDATQVRLKAEQDALLAAIAAEIRQALYRVDERVAVPVSASRRIQPSPSSVSRRGLSPRPFRPDQPR